MLQGLQTPATVTFQEGQEYAVFEDFEAGGEWHSKDTGIRATFVSHASIRGSGEVCFFTFNGGEVKESWDDVTYLSAPPPNITVVQHCMHSCAGRLYNISADREKMGRIAELFRKGQEAA